MRRAVVLAGGWAHPPDDLVRAMTHVLTGRGFDVTAVTDAGDIADALSTPVDLLVVGACWFAMEAERYTPEQRSEHAVRISSEQAQALDGLRVSGCPLLALHTAPICFDGWAPWRQWLGGTWNWETSWHPEPGPLRVNPVPGSPLAFDSFSVIDEEYQELTIDNAVVPVATSSNGHPVVWLNQTDHGRAAVNLLGHDARSLDDQNHRLLTGRLLDWLLAQADQ